MLQAGTHPGYQRGGRTPANLSQGLALSEEGPFTVRVSEKALRHSAKGIDRYIASRIGMRGR